jgi:imidazolonepropionase-like amidohydrolase
MDGPEIEGGFVLVEGGKIKAVGRDTAVPAGAKIIDCPGGWILPGLIDAHSTLGFADESGRTAADELSDPVIPQLLVLDGLNPFDKRPRRSLMAGITAALVTSGRGNVIGPRPAVIKPVGRTAEEMTLFSPAGIKMSLGEGPKDAFGSKGRLPATRMGAAYVVRKALLEAQDYLKKKRDFEAKKAAPAKGAKAGGAEPPKTDLALEPLAELLAGRLPAFIECYRADDIMTALRLADEFKFKAVLVGCTEGFKVADEIARRGFPAIVGPMGVGPKRMETEEVSFGNAAILAKAGVKVVLQPDDALGVGAAEELPLTAALAVKGGLDRGVALRGITLAAAEVLGVAARIGSLAPGKDADFVVFSGDPLHYRTRVDKVFIDGRLVFERPAE